MGLLTVSSDRNFTVKSAYQLIHLLTNRYPDPMMSDDTWTSNKEGVSGIAIAHFQEVYQSYDDVTSEQIQQALQDLAVPTLSHEDFKSFLQPFSLMNAREAVFFLPKNSAPGPDGLHANFFQ
ncbi:hypothetical protein K1719_007354 [Acacia pycnantha]|nr:hypothetical protein K1719_007354 [Acacia pycnantha]